MAGQEIGAAQVQAETPDLFRAVMQGLIDCHEWGYSTIQYGSRVIRTTNDRVVVAREFVVSGHDQPSEPTERIDAFTTEHGLPRELVQYLGTMTSAQAMREAISLEAGIPAVGKL